MTETDIAAAEKRGYARGYSAGRRRVAKEVSIERKRARENALWHRIYVAILPAAFQCEGWKFGEKPISSSGDRIRLAKIWADEGLATAKREGRV